MSTKLDDHRRWQRIREIRMELQLSQRELAAVLGVSKRSIENWEAPPDRVIHRRLPDRVLGKLLELRARRLNGVESFGDGVRSFLASLTSP